MAPEVLNKQPTTLASDVYSYSMVIYEIITQSKPYDGVNTAQILSEMASKHRPQLVTRYKNGCSVFVILVEECWRESSTERPTFDMIVIEIDKIFSEFSQLSGELVITSQSAQLAVFIKTQ
jgi:serine/threonine protein kinase